MKVDIKTIIVYKNKQNGNKLSRRLHMQMFRFWLVVIIGILVIGINTVSATEIYNIYLFYDNGKLTLDHDRDYSVIVDEGSIRNTKGDFRAEIVDNNGRILTSENFEPRSEVCVDYPPPNRALGGCRFVEQGRNSIQLSYVSSGTKLRIYDSTDVIIIEQDISNLTRCNLNNICDAFIGENSMTCPDDCTSSLGAGSAGQSKSNILRYWWVGIIIVGPIIFYLWRIRQRKKLAEQSLL